MNNIEKMKILKEILRPYQYEALKMCSKYLSDQSQGHALVHLPTGTGKTGIMASLCALNKSKALKDDEKRNILIIVPNAVLPLQTLKEIRNEFWQKLGKGSDTDKSIDYEKLDLDVKLLDSREGFNDLKSRDNTVYISTIQFLSMNIFKEEDIDKEILAKINSNIACILFDEGHREPAEKWSELTRKLSTKLILFTATPYRNDNSVFNINKDYIYSKKMKFFIDNKYISDVSFKSLESSVKTSKGLLCAKSNISNADLLSIIKEEYKNGKIIVRSSEVKRIEKIVEDINSDNSKITAAGFHSKIQKDKENCFQKGKDIIENEYYDVFVHSNTLVEGLDISAIKTIIFLDTFSNFKTNVQQIGRALRNPNLKANIYVPSIVKEDFEKQWENLLHYKYTNENDRYSYCLNRLMENYTYTIDDEEIEENILIPKKANIFMSEQDIWDDLIKEIHLVLDNEENYKVIYKNFTRDDSKDSEKCVAYYEEFSPSKYFKHLAYQNRNLEILILTRIKSRLNKGWYYFYYNSKNSRFFPTDNLLHSLNSKDLDIRKLLTEKFEIKKSSYQKAIPIFDIGVHTNQIRGRQIQLTQPSLEQKLSFNRNVLAKDNSKNTLIYINVVTSRVSKNGYASLDEYFAWNNDLVSQIESDSRPHMFLKRFAQIDTEGPKSPPTYIYGEFDDLYELVYEKPEEKDKEKYGIKIIDFSAEILQEGTGKDLINKFSINIDNCNQDFRLEFDDKTEKYKIKKMKSNNENIKLKNESETITLLEAIRKTNFIIYFLKDKLIYIGGKYYKSNIETSFSSPEEWSMWENIYKIDKLEECYSEKGKESEYKKLKKWPETSVFGAVIDYILNINRQIDNGADNDFEKINYLVCDDQGTEIADFIAIKSKKIIYIHCKDNSEKKDDKVRHSKLSATAFQEVCGQANKNMRYIIDRSQENNKYFENRKEKWKVKWPYYGKDAKTGYIDRCILGGSAEDIYNEFENLISQPDTKYEIWLVNTGLSYSALKEELEKSEEAQTEQLPQLIWLLQSTQDNFSQVGAKVKVFCRP